MQPAFANGERKVRVNNFGAYLGIHTEDR